MTKDLIFFRSAEGEFRRIERTPYDSEELLQALVEEHPDILSGEQINPDEPVRWLLVKREAGIPGGESEGNRWSVDHLLLDQWGVPTFVEVKRSSDTRIRREVVGQMLDYAANAGRYWPEDRIRSLATAQFEDRGGVDHQVAALLDETPSEEVIEAFWMDVGRNLKSGRLRLLFVADLIPPELKRVIEFLNEHLDTVEVLGVELRQYATGSVQALVPRVVGQTEAARDAKGRSAAVSRRPLTKEDFFKKISSEAAPLIQQILADSANNGLSVVWTSRGFNVRVPHDGTEAALLYAYHQGTNERPFDYLQGYTANLPHHLQEEAAHIFGAVPRVLPRGAYTYEVSLEEPGPGAELWRAVEKVVMQVRVEGDEDGRRTD